MEMKATKVTRNEAYAYVVVPAKWFHCALTSSRHQPVSAR